MFDRYVMVDYSASSTVGRAGGGRDGLWLALTGPGQPEMLQPYRTRSQLWADLAILLSGMVAAGNRVLCGLDFALGYPAGTALALGASPGLSAWQWTWQVLDAQINDTDDNSNNRFAVAADLNRRIHAGEGPFWGVPSTQCVSGLKATRPAFPVVSPTGALAEFRWSEQSLQRIGARPKSVWQLLGAGAVGSQTLVGLPRLARLIATDGLAGCCQVWPFQAESYAAEGAGGVMFAEVYPSLLPDEKTIHAVKDARQVVALARSYAQLDSSGRLEQAFDLSHLDAHTLEQVRGEEGWILPVAVDDSHPKNMVG